MSGIEFLLDTNVVVGWLEEKGAATELRLEHEPVESFAVSQITRMELLSFPALTDEERNRIDSFLSSITVILLDEAIETAAIALRRKSRLKLPDAIIAATASVHGLTLLTLDERLREAVRKSLI